MVSLYGTRLRGVFKGLFVTGGAMLSSMTFIEILLLGVGLALDAVVVAIGAGACMRLSRATMVRVALVFGGFQALMPLIGFVFGVGLNDVLAVYAPIIGFVLLAGIGLKMLYEAFTSDDDAVRDITRWGTLLTLAVATSIDALVVGVTFAFVPTNIPVAVGVIGVVTAVLSFAGAWAGARAERFLGSYIEVAGALILIAIAFKILLGF